MPPDVSCARYYGGQVERNVVTPIDITWVDAIRFRVVAGTAIDWHVTLGTSFAIRLLNIIASVIPERSWQIPAVLQAMGVVAKATLGTGRLNLIGRTPNGHRFIGTPRRLWSIESSHAIVDGVNIGPAGPLVMQASLGEFWLPQRGLLASVRARLEQPVNSSIPSSFTNRNRQQGGCV